MAFWQALDGLGASHSIHIDRPRGSVEPTEPDLIYPMDYGYLENTVSSDREGIDVWVGSLGSSVVTGVLCTIDARKADSEVKLLIGCTPDEARQALAIHNRGSQSALLLERPV
jgi:inorganic pyrophosphatase